LIDAALKKLLLEHCLKSDDTDKRKRAQCAFALEATPLQSADNQKE
jgi:hypothetical protein